VLPRQLGSQTKLHCASVPLLLFVLPLLFLRNSACCAACLMFTPMAACCAHQVNERENWPVMERFGVPQDSPLPLLALGVMSDGGLEVFRGPGAQAIVWMGAASSSYRADAEAEGEEGEEGEEREECMAGFTGANCDRCLAGHSGQQCQPQLTELEAEADGTTCAPGGTMACRQCLARHADEGSRSHTGPGTHSGSHPCSHVCSSPVECPDAAGGPGVRLCPLPEWLTSLAYGPA
jgi:hypothetical protein